MLNNTYPIQERKQRSPKSTLQLELQGMIQKKDLKTAISLFTSALDNNLNLSSEEYGMILYFCSTTAVMSSVDKSLALKMGFELFNRMTRTSILPSEPIITVVVCLANANGDPNYALVLADSMSGYGLQPKLRTYSPTLVSYCEMNRLPKAYDVESELKKYSIRLEELKIAGLLKISIGAGKAERVYTYMHQLRDLIFVSKETPNTIADWFKSIRSAIVGRECNIDEVKRMLDQHGGGYHGLGWLGSGRWRTQTVLIAADRMCFGCGNKLLSKIL